MRPNPLSAALVAAISLSGCQWYSDLLAAAETGGEELDNLVCQFDGICILNVSPDSEVIEHAVSSGKIEPYTYEGQCPNPVKSWAALALYTPTVPEYGDVGLIYAAYCPSMDHSKDYDEPSPAQAATAFRICWPDQAGWIPLWEQGHVGVMTTDGMDCTSVPPYANQYPYPLTLQCTEGVVCVGLDEECACRCPTSADSPCTETETLAETELGAELGELVCEGYPYRKIGDEYHATSCVWSYWESGNVPPAGRAWHGLDPYSQISCTGSRDSRITCSLGEGLREALDRDGQSVLGLGMSATLDAAGRVVLTSVSSASIAGTLGLASGDTIANTSSATADYGALLAGDADLDITILADDGHTFDLRLIATP